DLDYLPLNLEKMEYKVGRDMLVDCILEFNLCAKENIRLDDGQHVQLKHNLASILDDINAIMKADEKYARNFMKCINYFYLASASIVNHGKIGFKSFTGLIPLAVSEASRQQIQDG
ncbi:hypothetical protein L7F22_008117, partial [Adiantum nelumboides]|nr:hypothetical protein [Adiantum nelumboides]